MQERVDIDTGEILTISHGGLYAPFPIPAYRVLYRRQEHIAKDVLLCLVSHLGKGNRVAYPSYDTMQKETGRGRKSIAAGIRVLVDLGFVKVFKYRDGKKSRNKYYLQDSCWHSAQIFGPGMDQMRICGFCRRCKVSVVISQVSQGIDGFHHLGCGGLVLARQRKRTIPLSIPIKELNQEH